MLSANQVAKNKLSQLVETEDLDLSTVSKADKKRIRGQIKTNVRVKISVIRSELMNSYGTFKAGKPRPVTYEGIIYKVTKESASIDCGEEGAHTLTFSELITASTSGNLEILGTVDEYDGPYSEKAMRAEWAVEKPTK